LLAACATLTNPVRKVFRLSSASARTRKPAPSIPCSQPLAVRRRMLLRGSAVHFQFTTQRQAELPSTRDRAATLRFGARPLPGKLEAANSGVELLWSDRNADRP